MSSFFVELDHDQNDAMMLDEARKSADPIKLAVAYLVRKDGIASPAYFNPEFGTGEGVAEIRAFIQRASKYLQEGETLHMIVSEFRPLHNG